MAASNGAPPTSRVRSNSSGADPLLVCFSHLRWNFVYQRPQHLLSRAARRHRVVFFEEPAYEADAAPAGRLELSAVQPGVTVAVPVLPTGVAAGQETRILRSLLTQIMRGMRRPGHEFIAWYYTPMAMRFSDHLVPDLVVYDCMDELSAFKDAPPRLTRLEHALFDRADVVFTGGQSLFEAKQRQHRNVHAFPSSIDVGHFATARSPQFQPADQMSIPRPRVGYFGVIDDRMDVELVARLAERRPDWQFVMLGPVVKVDPSLLPRRGNIHWLGSKSYAELPSYLATWDAGFMPFAMNEATRFISPTKTPEFLAAGVPVVSTPVRDVVRPYGEDGTVGIAADAEGFAVALDAAMSRPREQWLARVDARLAGMSWDRTWMWMAARMEEAKSLNRGDARALRIGPSRATAGREAAGV